MSVTTGAWTWCSAMADQAENACTCSSILEDSLWFCKPWPRCWLESFSQYSVFTYKVIYIYANVNHESEAYQELNRCMARQLYCCRHYHAYCDEDTMGTIKGLAKMVHYRLLELRCLMRYLLRLATYTRHWTADEKVWVDDDRMGLETTNFLEIHNCPVLGFLMLSNPVVFMTIGFYRETSIGLDVVDFWLRTMFFGTCSHFLATELNVSIYCIH